MFAERTHANSWVVAFVTMLVTLTLPGFFVMRWWLRRSRAAGIPLMVHTRPNKLRFGGLAAVFMIAAFALEFASFAVAHSRLAEAAISAFLVAPAAFFLVRSSFAQMNPPKPQETRTLQVSSTLYVALPLIFSLNLALQLHPHRTDDVPTFHNALIALYFTLIPMFPSSAYFMRRRYQVARAAALQAIAS